MFQTLIFLRGFLPVRYPFMFHDIVFPYSFLHRDHFLESLQLQIHRISSPLYMCCLRIQMLISPQKFITFNAILCVTAIITFN